MVRVVRRVLVIEDDRETAGQLADCLSANGYAVDVAADGESGCALPQPRNTRS